MIIVAILLFVASTLIAYDALKAWKKMEGSPSAAKAAVAAGS